MYPCPCCEFLTLSEKKREGVLKYVMYVGGRMITFNMKIQITKEELIKLV
jgi:hypothetical protein